MALRSLWEHPFRAVKQVGIVLGDALPDAAVMPSLFDEGERRWAVQAVDKIAFARVSEL